MNFSKFIRVFVEKLETLGEYCILRNYAGFPDKNEGTDIDLLIPSDKIPILTAYFQTLPDVTITSIVRRSMVTSVFMHGIASAAGDRRGLQIDLIHTLGFKGLSYLDAAAVLQESTYFRKNDFYCRIAAPTHEALISLMSTYLIGGRFPERYREPIEKGIEGIASEKPIGCIPGFLTKDIRRQVTRDILSGKAKKSTIFRLRANLVASAFMLSPQHTLSTLLNHYSREFRIRYLSKMTMHVVVLGPDGSGKSTLINHCTTSLIGAVKEVEVYHLIPKKGANTPTKNPHSDPPRGALTSALKICYWFLLYWQNRLFSERRQLTLVLWDRYYFDLLVDPERYRYGGSLRIAEWLSKFIPQPELTVLLKADPDVINHRKDELGKNKLAELNFKYVSMAATDKWLVIDTNSDLTETQKRFESAVVKAIEENKA